MISVRSLEESTKGVKRFKNPIIEIATVVQHISFAIAIRRLSPCLWLLSPISGNWQLTLHQSIASLTPAAGLRSFNPIYDAFFGYQILACGTSESY